MQGVYYGRKRMQEMRKIANYVYLLYSTMCILRGILYSAAEELNSFIKNLQIWRCGPASILHLHIIL